MTNLILRTLVGTCEYRAKYITLPSHLYYSPVFEQSAQAILASPTESLTYCPSTTQSAPPTTVPNTQSVPPTSAPATSSDDPQTIPPPAGTSEASAGRKVSSTAAVGGALGGALGLVVLGGIIAMLRYRRRLRRLRGTTASEVPIGDIQEPPQNTVERRPASGVIPFLGQYEAVSSLQDTMSSKCTIP